MWETGKEEKEIFVEKIEKCSGCKFRGRSVRENVTRKENVDENKLRRTQKFDASEIVGNGQRR